MHRGQNRQNSHVYLMHCLERSLNYYYNRQTDGRTDWRHQQAIKSWGSEVLPSATLSSKRSYKIPNPTAKLCKNVYDLGGWLILNEKVAKCVAVFDPHDFSLQIVGRGEGRQASSKDLDMFESLVHGWLLYFLWSKCISYLICNRSNSSSVKFMFSKKATKIEKNFTVDLTLST